MSCFHKTHFLHISVAEMFVNKWTPVLFEYPHLSGKDTSWQTGVSHALNIIGISLIATTVSQHNSVTTQQCHNTKLVIFQEKRLKVLKCYTRTFSASSTTQMLSSG